MFPNIPREFGIKECIKHLEARENPLFSTACIVKALEITLDNNIASFNGTTYLQCKGTAMGPKNSCPYADNSMGYIDEAVHDNNPECSSPNVIPDFWARLRDDIYMPWVDTLENLELFKIWLNSIHPSLKFTFTISREGVEFLDTYVYSIGHKIYTKIYSKPSDTHCYLVPFSCHKTHIIKNIPYNIARRVLQNNSEESNYSLGRIEYTEYLKNRGYSEEFVNEAFDKVEKLERKQLYALKNNVVTTKQCTPLVMDTNPALPDMSKIVHKHSYILELDDVLKSTIPPDTVFVSCRGAKTVRDLLIHSKLNNSVQIDRDVDITPDPEVGCIKCGGTCYFCKNYLKDSKKFTSYHTNQMFNISDTLSCNTKGVIYIIDCIKCKKSYVGYTTGTMKMRFSNDKSHIKTKKRTCTIVDHYLDYDHDLIYNPNKQYDETFSKHVEVTLIEQVKLDPNDSQAEKERKCELREGYWQTQLKTFERYGGLNKRHSKKYQTTT